MSENPGFFGRLPDLNALAASSGELVAQVDGLAGAAQGFDALLPTGILDTFAALPEKFDIDLSALDEGLPAVLDNVAALLPPELSEKLDLLLQGYEILRGLLDGSEQPDVSAVLTQMAGVLLSEAVELITAELAAGDYLSPAQAAAAGVLLGKLEAIAAELPTDAEDILPFLNTHFFGISPDLLADPLSALEDAVDLNGHLSLDSLGLLQDVGALIPAETFTRLTDQIAALELAARGAADEAIAEAEAALTVVDDALAAIDDAFAQMEASFQTGKQTLLDRIDSFDLTPALNTYADVLNTLTLPENVSFEALLAQLRDLIDSIDISRAAGQITARLDALAVKLDTSLDLTPVENARGTFIDTLRTVETHIAQIPTEEVRVMLEDALALVEAKFAELGLDQVKEQILAGIAQVEQFITDAIVNSSVRQQIDNALQQFLALLDSLSLQELLDRLRLNEIIDTQIVPLFEEVQARLNGYNDQLQELLGRLDDVSYAPLGAAVSAQIDDMTKTLRGINPTTLGSAEKTAIKAAVAVTENIDLTTIIADQVKGVYRTVEAEVKGLLNQVRGLLENLWQYVERYGPDELLRPVEAIMQTAVIELQRISGDLLFDPLYAEINKLLDMAAALDPAQLLDPLQAPYDTVVAAMRDFAPERWLGPLQAQYQEILGHVDLLDPAPLFDQAEAARDALFADARGLALAQVDGAALPLPLADPVRSLVQSLLDALLSTDPNATPEPWSLDVAQYLTVTNLLSPLDTAYDKLLTLAQAAPLDDVVTAINTVHEVLDQLAPAALQARLLQGVEVVAGLVPANMAALGLDFDVDGVKAALAEFDAKVTAAGDLPAAINTRVTAIRKRLQALITLVNPRSSNNIIARLRRAFDELVAAVRAKIEALDLGLVSPAYARMTGRILGLLPPFLRQPVADSAALLAGMEQLRPTTLGEQIIGPALARLHDALEPLQAGVARAVNVVLAKLRVLMGLIDPLSLRDDVQAVFVAVKARVQTLDIDFVGLADRLMQMLFQPLEALNPAGFRPVLGEAYNRLVTLIREQVFTLLDPVRDAVNAKIDETRATILSVLGQVRDIIQLAAGILKDLIAKLKNLIFNEVLGRVEQIIDNLGVSFDKEVDGIANAFRQMLRAVPV